MTLKLFIDASCDPYSKIGYGAKIALRAESSHHPIDAKPLLETRRFTSTSSSRLELETLLWAIAEIPENTVEVVVYTDSQTICGLRARKEKLITAGFRSSSGRPLSQSDLYKRFYEADDRLRLTFKKVVGHTRAREKGSEEQIFSLVDRASRSALRQEFNRSESPNTSRRS